MQIRLGLRSKANGPGRRVAAGFWSLALAGAVACGATPEQTAADPAQTGAAGVAGQTQSAANPIEETTMAQPINSKAPTATPFDHSGYDAVLKAYVDEAGQVDYAGLGKDRAGLDAYVAALGRENQAQVAAWSRADQMAFYINAYNAITLARIINHYPPKGSGLLHPKISIRNISGVWDKITNPVGGEDVTLEFIEHKILRARYKDPRIHAALVCAAISCPNLAREAYTGARLEEQLDREAANFVRNSTKSDVRPDEKTVYLSSIFDWFKEDFEHLASGVPGATEAGGKAAKLAGGLGFIEKFGDPADAEFLRSGQYKVKILKYDWTLNEQ